MEKAINYLKTAERHPLLIMDYRYGAFYGILLPNVDSASDIDSAIDYDKTMNLINFLNEYECFPFAQGDTHEEIIIKIKERVNKFFDENGLWKINIYKPGEKEKGFTPLNYWDVWDIILGWFEEAGKNQNGVPWHVIDEKENEKHWLFEALREEIKLIKKN